MAAIRIANDSIHRLWGGITSGNFDRAFVIAKRISTNTLGISGGHLINGHLRFGGYKPGGIGRAWDV